MAAKRKSSREYKFYSDLGGGWLKVPRKEIEQLGLSQKISKASYQRHSSVYLEANFDMEAFIDAHREQNGVTVAVVETPPETLSPIRSYAIYLPPETYKVEGFNMDNVFFMALASAAYLQCKTPVHWFQMTSTERIVYCETNKLPHVAHLSGAFIVSAMEQYAEHLTEEIGQKL